MKRSKFFENWVFSAKDVTARSVTSWAPAAFAASANNAVNSIRFIDSPWVGIGFGHGSGTHKGVPRRCGRGYQACAARVSSATFF